MFDARSWIASLVVAVSSGVCTLGAAQAPDEFDQLNLTIVVSKYHDASHARPSLLVHFHGAPATTERNFHASGLSGVLVTVNCKGLSSAYRKPFENVELFSYVVNYARQELVADGRLDRAAEWERIDLSCFSAGYGAVRELLRDVETLRRIDSVIAADSIYASIRREGDSRLVDESQMQPFLNFARHAVRGEKAFLISHSQLPVEPYASTVETADYLLQQTALARQPLFPVNPTEFAPISLATRGRFTVLGYAGSNAEGHLKHLRHISSLWQKLREIR